MAFLAQTTITRPIEIAGAGLHTGAAARVVLGPAAAGRGINFRRNGREIPAVLAAVVNTHFNTAVGDDEARVSTIEHLMAALALAGIDNISIEVDGPELPALDGSAAPWLEALGEAGPRDLAAPREVLHIMERVSVTDDHGRSISAEPFDGRVVDVSINFPDAAIGAQRVKLDLDDAADVRRVALARTFCRRDEIDRLRAKGLSLGGTLDNAVVVDGAHVLNPSGLRDPQEFALHKALDLIGDLRLAGAPLIGRIVADRPGHDLNARFLAALLADSRAVMRGPEAARGLRASA
ncbi:MAG: UDP-3-O-acyl-N-acetylglucosamine deacetylase [Parvularculaceae bacterium]|nr:UDP-3-O-acyl-N-acetylglucosamine deacetylase [Parvularculaceae bacterium]